MKLQDERDDRVKNENDSSESEEEVSFKGMRFPGEASVSENPSTDSEDEIPYQKDAEKAMASLANWWGVSEKEEGKE